MTEHVLSTALSLTLIVLAFVYIKKLWVGSKAETMVTLSVASGDSESLVFQTNFRTDEDAIAKEEKLSELYKMVQERRNYNHEQWVEMKAKDLNEKVAKAEAEAEAKVKQLRQEKA